MRNFSNRYIFLYISALVLIIAALLAVVSLGLKNRQEHNRQLEKAQQILKAAGYNDVAKELALDLFGKVSKPLESASGREMYAIQCADGTSGTVVYVNGKGLWGPLWGYVVLANDNNTIKGVVFSHKSETPGLGANITEDKFANAFIGKKLYDKNGKFVAIKLLPKGKSGGEVDNDNRVDAISGATITSRGVQEMLYQSLNEIEK